MPEKKENNDEDLMVNRVDLFKWERNLIVRGLEKLSNDAEKISVAAERMYMGRAAKEAYDFKASIETLKQKISGQEKLI